MSKIDNKLGHPNLGTTGFGLCMKLICVGFDDPLGFCKIFQASGMSRIIGFSFCFAREVAAVLMIAGSCLPL
jgi:hypothetical protein